MVSPGAGAREALLGGRTASFSRELVLGSGGGVEWGFPCIFQLNFLRRCPACRFTTKGLPEVCIWPAGATCACAAAQVQAALLVAGFLLFAGISS